MSLPPMAGPGWYPMPPGRPVVNPLDFPRLLGETAALFRRGFGPLVMLGAVASVAGGTTTFVLVSLYGPVFLTGLVSFNAAGLTAPMMVCAGASLAVAMVTAQCCAMIAQVTRQLMAGARPDLRSAWHETTTIVPRLLLPYLVLSAGTLLASALGTTVALDGLRGVRSSAADRTAASRTLLGLLAVTLFAGAAAVVASYWLRVKLFLVVPAASLEGLSGFEPVRRSWTLTRGVGGSIIAALLLAGLAEGVVGGLAGQAGSTFGMPDLSTGGIGGLVTLVSRLLPAFAVVTAVNAALAAITLPFLTVMSTILHRLQLQRGPSG